jgi:hypothetical protein
MKLFSVLGVKGLSEQKPKNENSETSKEKNDMIHEYLKVLHCRLVSDSSGRVPT